MAEFQLDTSGEVYMTAGLNKSQIFMWRNLSPFTQGYVEAALPPQEALHYSLTDRFAGFSDLAPSTLARMIADCEQHVRLFLGGDSARHEARGGSDFWQSRAAGCMPSCPPQTPFLGDDGKIYLRDQKP